MPTANRIADFISEGPAPEIPATPSGRKPNHLRIAAGGSEPGIPRDLLAKLLAPPADARLHDRRFAVLRQQLIDEFRPIDALELYEIDLCAADLLHLASIRQAMELVTAPTVSAEVVASARKAPARKKLLKLLQWLIKRGEACKLFDCCDQEAEPLARRLIEEFQSLKRLVAEADAERAEIIAKRADDPNPNEPAGDIEDFDPEDPRRRELLEIILPIEPVLIDLQQAQQVLTGNRPLNPDERLRWTAILKLAAETVAAGAIRLNDAAAKADAAQRTILLALAQDPLKLAVMHRCASQFEEAIQARLRRLKAGR
jgi:hypothetical protein